MGLLADADWRLLVELARIDRAGDCYLRRITERQYQAHRLPDPEAVTAMPNGMLLWQVTPLTHTAKAVDRLLVHPDGPLVEVLDVPLGICWGQPDTATQELVRLSAAGREHYTRHHGEYRRLYLDIDAPDPTEPTVQSTSDSA